ncbi:hypothetical protein PoB_003751200 [Plakobranchus ocellatus]|uniref:Secreted protein n=1 Tax=Plakobranchus ocellatus TaxID=259542 RepID=A0AAV4AVH3_9GAST|nr:hypothetical protein PoB_003751200 [Plakobranchus ocellatus]
MMLTSVHFHVVLAVAWRYLKPHRQDVRRCRLLDGGDSGQSGQITSGHRGVEGTGHGKAQLKEANTNWKVSLRANLGQHEKTEEATRAALKTTV